DLSRGFSPGNFTGVRDYLFVNRRISVVVLNPHGDPDARQLLSILPINMNRDSKMINRIVRRARKIVRPWIHGDPDSFLRKVSGVIHVGANLGQERVLYSRHGLNVIWIEPIPEIFRELSRNVEGFPWQRAYQYLITDRDDAEYTFHISNND